MPIVQVENLTKVYGAGDTAVTALDHVHMAIDEREFVAVMGPSGCGKSTLLHLIGGLDRASEGSIRFNGRNLADLDDTQITELRRRQVGLVFQFFNLIPVLTAVENTALPLILDGVKPAEAHARAAGWLTRFGLGDRLSSRPDQFSGGQQQRIAIARALVAEPSLILADGPTGNLDSRAGDEIAGLLHQVSEEWGRAVLMVTHDPGIAARADRILFLKDGKVVDETRLSGDGGQAEARMVKERAEAL